MNGFTTVTPRQVNPSWKSSEINILQPWLAVTAKIKASQ